MVKSLRRPPVKGSPDPSFPGHVLVPVSKGVPGLPKVNYSVPATSFFRVEQRTNRPVAVVTVTPDGLPVAWDTCGQCAALIRNCACSSGVSCPSSVVHIYVVRGGTKPEQPLTVQFQPPMVVSPINRPKKPKRVLRRKSNNEEELMAEANAQINRAFRKLKRK